ncbi:hypothetical protein [Solimonas variicoloris]|uniref:hypothetical protein n=1 Tax=Solimonas variicoloris TaxID=254408 RepID=UPI000360E60E|nr:hypothetical protein [Solimonas variicoloris]
MNARYCATALLLLSATVHAGPEGKKAPEPTAEAYAACAGRNAGDLVSFTTKEHTLEGVCEQHGGRLALRPSAPPPDGRPALPGHDAPLR